MLNKATISWTTKQIAKMVESGKLTFENVVQRSYVWEKARKAELIHSIMEGYPVPPFYARRVDGKVYDFLDGKQRMNAITSFLNDGYELMNISEIEMEDGTWQDVNGKKFSELPEELQDRIRDYSLTVYYYDGITTEQTRTLFKKLNNGKPLSAKERNIANCVDIDTIADIGQHELFAAIMTEKALEARKHLPIIMKLYMILTQDITEVSFESKDFNEIISSVVLTEDDKNMIVSVLDKMYSTWEVLDVLKEKARKKLGQETHLVSLAPFFKMAVDMEISDKLMADFIVDCGGDVMVSEAYTNAASKGSAKNASIMKRNEELEKAWSRFFAEDESEDDITGIEAEF